MGAVDQGAPLAQSRGEKVGDEATGLRTARVLFAEDSEKVVRKRRRIEKEEPHPA